MFYRPFCFKQAARLAVLLSSWLGLGAPALPQIPPLTAPPCTTAQRKDLRFSAEAPFLVAMALCRTTECLSPFYPAVMGSGGTGRLVYYIRMFALKPHDSAVAGELLASLPPNGGSYSQVTFLGVELWPGESDQQMTAGDELGDSLSDEAAGAAILRPDQLLRFVRYSLVAVSNPHDDIGDAAVRVCKHAPARFLAAVSRLSAGERRTLSRYVIRARACRQVAVAEAQ